MNIFSRIYRWFVPKEEIVYEKPDDATQTQKIHRKVNGKIKNTVIVHYLTEEQVKRLWNIQEDVQPKN